MDSTAFSSLKPGAVIINTARGPIIDTDALMSALDNGVVSSVGLDVTDPEPLPKDHPLFTKYGQRVLIVPHIGSATNEARTQMVLLAIQHVEEALSQGFVSHSPI